MMMNVLQRRLTTFSFINTDLQSRTASHTADKAGCSLLLWPEMRNAKNPSWIVCVPAN